MFDSSGPLTLHLDSEKTRISCVTAYRDTLNRNVAKFNLELSFCVVFLAVFLPLASGEQHIISNLLERFIFFLMLHLVEMLGYIFQFES